MSGSSLDGSRGIPSRPQRVEGAPCPLCSTPDTVALQHTSGETVLTRPDGNNTHTTEASMITKSTMFEFWDDSPEGVHDGAAYFICQEAMVGHTPRVSFITTEGKAHWVVVTTEGGIG